MGPESFGQHHPAASVCVSVCRCVRWPRRAATQTDFLNHFVMVKQVLNLEHIKSHVEENRVFLLLFYGLRLKFFYDTLRSTLTKYFFISTTASHSKKGKKSSTSFMSIFNVPTRFFAKWTQKLWSEYYKIVSIKLIDN